MESRPSLDLSLKFANERGFVKAVKGSLHAVADHSVGVALGVRGKHGFFQSQNMAFGDEAKDVAFLPQIDMLALTLLSVFAVLKDLARLFDYHFVFEK